MTGQEKKDFTNLMKLQLRLLPVIAWVGGRLQRCVVRKLSALGTWPVVWVLSTSNLVLDSPSSFTTIAETVVAVCVRTNTFPDM